MKERKESTKMIQIYAELGGINYEKLLSRIGQEKKRQSKLAAFILKIALNTFVLKNAIKHPLLLKTPIVNLATDYGILLNKLKIGGDTLIQKNSESKGLLNISVMIESIDYSKIISIVNESSKNEKDSVKDATLPEIIRIIKPFIEDTMAMIPSSAIAELFDLLAKDKVIALTGNYGISLSSISITPGCEA